MYRLQLDSETTLGDIKRLPGISMVAMFLHNLYTPAIKFDNDYIFLDMHDDSLLYAYNESNIYDLVNNNDITAITFYISNEKYDIIKYFQDFLFDYGFRSSLIRVDFKDSNV